MSEARCPSCGRRRVSGAQNGNAKLTSQQVGEIRKRRRHGALGIKLAAEFGISKGHVSRICSAERWAN